MNKLKNEIFNYPMCGDEIVRQATYARVMCQKFNQLLADDYESQTVRGLVQRQLSFQE